MKREIAVLLLFATMQSIVHGAVRPSQGMRPYQCPLFQYPVQCLIDPCAGKKCPSHPDAICKPSQCGPCRAIFYDKYSNEVQCNDCPGGQTRHCFVNACRYPNCPRHTQALCLTTCFGCIAHYYDKFENELKCDCPSGGLVELDCKRDMCNNKVCHGFPDAECRISKCGGCHVEFFDSEGHEVKCLKQPQDPSCPNIGPPGFSICSAECTTSDDCFGDLVCCSYGCRRTCVNPKSGFESKCPKIGKGDKGICVHECSYDDDCKTGQVCCSNGCGKQCMYPPMHRIPTVSLPTM